MTARGISSTLVGLGLVLTAACGDSLSVENTGPRGSVGGILVDAITRAPIVDAEVVVLAGGEVKDPQHTDETGAFGVNDVRAGDVIITITPAEGDSHRGAWVRAHLDNAAGEFPASNTLTLGPIGLVPPGADFTLRVLDAEGTPVSQYVVTLRHFVEYVDFKSGVGENVGEVVMQGTTGTDGRVTFPGFPDYFGLSPEVNDTVIAHLPPLAADTAFDFPGGSQTLNMRSLPDPTPDVILDPNFATSLSVRASTIQQLVSGVGPGSHATVININDAVHIAFNLPIQPDARVTVTDERGVALAAPPAVSVSDDSIAVNFGNDPLLPGNEYNIAVHAVAAVTGLNVTADVAGSFFTAPINDAVTPVNITSVSPTVTRIEFSEPIGIGGGTNVSMAGVAECVAFLDFDINAAGGIGDYPGERGNANCWGGSNYYLYSAEPDPTGLPSLSGYTRIWEINHPDVPTGTRADLVFSRVGTAGYIVERADGRPVADFTGTTSIPLP